MKICTHKILSLFLLIPISMILWACNDDIEPKSLPGEAQTIEVSLDSDNNVILATATIKDASAYAWMLNGELVASTSMPKFIPDITGDYSVAGVNSAGMGKPSESIYVDLSGVPSAPELTIRTSDEGMVIIDASAQGVIGYRWYYGDELLQRGTSSHFIPPMSGEYRVEAYNACGTSPSKLITVTVKVVNLLNPEVVPDDNFRSYIALILADNPNFYSSVEAAKVLELNLQGTGVADITGIRYFTGLKTLRMQYCSNILIMDLHHNKDLEVLDLYNTKKLRSVDISGLSKIREININDSHVGVVDISDCIESLETLNAGWEGYETLNLEKAKKLKYLNLGSNSNLSSLKISGLPELETLILNATKITELDLTGCKSLNSLSCSWAPIDNLKIDANAPLKELKVARCSSNVLANIKLDDYKNTLETLYADEAGISQDLNFSNCATLKEVQLDKNHFKNVNFSGCSSLTTLRVAENSALKSCTLDGCTSLTTIYCYQTGINSLDFSDSPNLGMAILFENKNLKSVDFSGCSQLYWISAEYTSLGPDIDISDSTVLESVNFLQTKVKRVKINSYYNLMNLPFSGKLPPGSSFVHNFD